MSSYNLHTILKLWNIDWFTKFQYTTKVKLSLQCFDWYNHIDNNEPTKLQTSCIKIWYMYIYMLLYMLPCQSWMCILCASRWQNFHFVLADGTRQSSFLGALQSVSHHQNHSQMTSEIIFYLNQRILSKQCFLCRFV